ncbi:MAG TPA: DUF4150 domain-containing protein, partial [Polyangiaceae bacterium]|nr:DUF4150 domain-containing protein [Polyangiaceae bacterium]
MSVVGKVTAVKMDLVTKKSGHQMTGMAVSVCLTPAAPSPLPIPYPTMGTVAEGIDDPCMRTKAGGAIIMTVGSCMSKCHGNEPGTLKEVVSLNTAGPCFPALGAPIVLMELGMAGITGSIGQMNKLPVPGVGGSASGAGGGAGGGGGGGGGGSGPGGQGTQGPGGGGGDGGGSNDGAAPPEPPAPPAADGQAAAGHPIDVITGTLFTQSEDFVLPGLFRLQFVRIYQSSAVQHDCGLGRGWAHNFSWRGTRRGDRFTLLDDQFRTLEMDLPAGGELLLAPYGRQIRVEGDDVVVEGIDDLARVMKRVPGTHDYELAELRDEFGNVAELEWDHGELVAIVDSVGRRAAQETNGRLRSWWLSVEDGEGKTHRRRLVTFDIDENRNLVEVVDAGGTSHRYHYDEDHYLLSEQQPDGVVYHFVHANVGGQKRCVETWAELPGQDILALLGRPPSENRQPRGLFHTQLEYIPGRYETRMVDAEGGVHRYQGNRFGLVERYVDPRGSVTTIRYDDLGRVVAVTDPHGHKELRRYTPEGRPAAFIAADGSAVTYRYDDEDHSVVTRGPDGFESRERRIKGRVTEIVDGNGRARTAEWDDRGLNVGVAFPNGQEHRLEYDAHGNLTRYHSGKHTTRYVYDLFGMPVEIESPSGATTRFRYDSYGYPVHIEGPRGTKLEHACDWQGRILATQYPGGGEAHFRYVAGALVEQKHPDGSVWRMGYDALKRLRWIENPAGERHSMRYDAAGNPLSETTFAGLTYQFEYDAVGRLAKLTRPDGSTITYVRDGAGRIVSREHSSGASEHLQWDRFGRLVRATSGVASVELAYRPDGMLTRDTQRCGGYTFSVEYVYDDDGSLVGRRYSSGWDVALQLDASGGVVSVEVHADDDTVALDRELDPDGREVRRRFANGGAELHFERDPEGHLASVTALDGNETTLHRRQFQRHALGPLERIVDSARGDRTFTLDPHGRPLSVSGLGINERFEYAKQGTALSDTMAAGVGGRPTRCGSSMLHWDALGRLERRVDDDDPQRSWSYRYDHADRLVEATRGDGFKATYLYDPLGRRLAETIGDSST